MSVERTEAIVLRRTNYGEADRILKLITPLGQRSAMAKAVRREKSKLAGGIELFAISDVTIQTGKGDLGVLTSARLIHFYRAMNSRRQEAEQPLNARLFLEGIFLDYRGLFAN